MAAAIVKQLSDRRFRKHVVNEALRSISADDAGSGDASAGLLIADRRKLIARLDDKDVLEALFDQHNPTAARAAFPGVSAEQAERFVGVLVEAIINTAFVRKAELRPSLLQGLQAQAERDDLKDGQAEIYRVVLLLLERFQSQPQRLRFIYGDPPLPYGRYDPEAREDLNAALSEQMRESDRPLAVVAVHGLGGTGKTQLVRHWWDAALASAEFDHGLWLNLAEDASVQLQGLVADLGQSGADPVEAVKALLRNTDSAWLLVLDNANTSEAAKTFLVSNTHSAVRTIITSRHTTGWESLGVTPLPMSLLSVDRSVKLLRDIAQRPDDAVAEAEKLADRLGYLPVLLTLAANVIREDPDPNYGFAAYLADCQNRLPELRPNDQAGYNKAIEALWNESLTTVEGLQPGSRALFELLSLIDWNNATSNGSPMLLAASSPS